MPDLHKPSHVSAELHHPRLAELATPRDPVLQSNLGHFDNLLDVMHHQVSDLEDFHQLSHQRHRSIEHRHGHEGVDVLLHGVSLHPLRSGREPPSSGTLSSSSSPKYRVPGSWEVGSCGTSPCSASRTHPPRPWPSCPRGAAWCVVSARAMAIDCRSCLKAARSGRPLRRCAAPAARSTIIMSTARGRLNR